MMEKRDAELDWIQRNLFIKSRLGLGAFIPNEVQRFILRNLKPMSIVWKGRGVGSTNLLLAHMIYNRIESFAWGFEAAENGRSMPSNCLVIAPNRSHVHQYTDTLDTLSYAADLGIAYWPTVTHGGINRGAYNELMQFKHILFADIDQWSVSISASTSFDAFLSWIFTHCRPESVIIEASVSAIEHFTPSARQLFDERLVEIYVTENQKWANSKENIKMDAQASFSDAFVRKLRFE